MNSNASIKKIFSLFKQNKISLSTLLFILALLLVYIILDYQHIIFYRPQALHFMRQTDCLSIVQSYYNSGSGFFEPQVLNLQSTEGKAMGEFPLLYYLTAVCYHLFGPHEFILRLINLTLISIGFYSVYRLLLDLLNSIVYAFTFTFLFLSSTILLYYACNFLPDAGALGLTLTAFYFFHQFIKNKTRQKSFAISTLLFTLAALIKITYGLYLIAALLTFIYTISFIKQQIKLNKKVFYLLGYMTALLIVAGWYIYLIEYNRINHVDSFLTSPIPIWKLSSDKILMVWDYISHLWYYEYYYPSSIHIMLGVAIIGLFFLKNSDKTILLFTTLSFLGSLSYIALFFSQFKDHDYYFMTIIPTILLLVINSFIAIEKTFPKLVTSLIAKLILITIMMLSLNFGREKLASRYATTDTIYSPIGVQLNHADKYLQNIHVSPTAKILVIKDQTPNGSLYFLNRRGWTFADTNKLEQSKSILSQSDYLILSDSLLVNNTIITKLKKKRVGEFNSAIIYQLNK